MLIIPAIDLQDGCVVRLVQGKDNLKIYSRDPLETARHLVKGGAEFLHLVDLDGAFSGVPKNLAQVKEIARNIPVPVEFGGGVRSIPLIKELLSAGIRRVVLGTKAAQDKDFLKQALNKFKERLIVSIDAQEGKVRVKGWYETAKAPDLLSFAKTLKAAGLKELIYTDISKDGMLSGPDLAGIKRLLKEVKIRLIASGGISCLEDILRLKKLEKEGLSAVIIGKALYEGRFTLAEAIKAAKDNTQPYQHPAISEWRARRLLRRIGR